MNNNDRINVRNVYIELLNKLKDVEGVDIHYIDRLVALLEKDIDLIEVDVDHIKDLIPDDATTDNLLATMSDLPADQVNSDWNATSGVAEILNKPTIPAAQVNSDWNATSGVAEILNKPTIPTVYTPVVLNLTLSGWSSTPDSDGFYTCTVFWIGAINPQIFQPICSCNHIITATDALAAYNAIDRIDFGMSTSCTSLTAYSKITASNSIYLTVNAFK